MPLGVDGMAIRGEVIRLQTYAELEAFEAREDVDLQIYEFVYTDMKPSG